MVISNCVDYLNLIVFCYFPRNWRNTVKVICIYNVWLEFSDFLIYKFVITDIPNSNQMSH